MGERSEVISLKQIPENLTTRDKCLSIIRKDDNFSIVGALLNGPIEIGKPIELALGNTSEVASITQEGDVFSIRTKSGSEYRFDPKESYDFPPEKSEK